MENFLVVVECAIELNGKFLIIKRPKDVMHAADLLAFPGGKVEYSDGPESCNILEKAIKREVFEEVGLQLIDPIHFVTSSYFIDSAQVHVLDNIFHCIIDKTNPVINPNSREVPEYFWLSPKEINERQDSPIWLKRYINCILKHDV